jgi:hypothetical protein
MKTLIAKQFDELSPEEREIVLNNYRDINTEHGVPDDEGLTLYNPLTEAMEKKGYSFDWKHVYYNLCGQGQFWHVDTRVSISAWLKSTRQKSKYRKLSVYLRNYDGHVSASMGCRDTTDIDNGDGCYSDNEKTIDEFLEVCGAIAEEIRDFFSAMRSEFVRYYEYMESDEAVAETLRMNGYEFYNGHIA